MPPDLGHFSEMRVKVTEFQIRLQYVASRDLCRKWDTALAKVFHVALNRLDPLNCRRRIDVDQFEAVREIRFFVQLSKSDRVGKTDSPRFSRRHKSEASDEEHLRPIDPLAADSFDLEAQSIGYGVPKPLGEGESTNRGAVVELDSRGVAQIDLAMPLRFNNTVNERRISPRFVYSILQPRGDHVRSCLVCCGKTLLCKLPKDCGLARPRWAGEYESINVHYFLHDTLNRDRRKRRSVYEFTRTKSRQTAQGKIAAGESLPSRKFRLSRKS